ncbi:MAG: response regulator transcription factor [Oscillospiraceae bacterium]|nr:response regulator transcription factor [Oscillospiraceae bacterium]
MPKKILIVDDQIISRQLFESVLLTSGHYEVAASIGTAAVADVYCAGNEVDLVLMDVVMNDGSNGLDAAERIKNSYPHIKIVIVTSMPDSSLLKKARRIGVDSFWYKEQQEMPILEVIDRTMAGESIYPDATPVVPLGNTRNVDLTERELDVLRHLAEGLTDKEISERMNLSVAAVRYHVNNLISKTGCSSRTELAVTAVRRGITVPEMG